MNEKREYARLYVDMTWMKNENERSQLSSQSVQQRMTIAIIWSTSLSTSGVASILTLPRRSRLHRTPKLKSLLPKFDQLHHFTLSHFRVGLCLEVRF